MSQSRRTQFRPAIALLASALIAVGAGVVGSPPTATAALPPNEEPGVIIRSYDVGTLKSLCELKPDQTPNSDKKRDTIDWSTTDDFGAASGFQSEALANLTITEAGAYTFRLVSDDGSRLTIGSDVVIRHDGQHAATANDGTINLAAGSYPLRVDYFDAGGEKRLHLLWRAPGTDEFVTVPKTVLSRDAGAVGVTDPQTKECIAGTDGAGDGLALKAVHPDYELFDLSPKGDGKLQPKVTGMDWMPNNDLVISTWGELGKRSGEVYLVKNVLDKASPEQVRFERLAAGLNEPMGLTVVDGVVYVSERHQLTRLLDKDSAGLLETEAVATWPNSDNFHEFAFGLLYRDGYFYLNLSIGIDHSGASTDPQDSPERGTTLKINKNTGDVEYIAGGLRTPNGIGWGPDGELFATDNQGDWLPASKLFHVQPGHFYGSYLNPAGRFDHNPVTAPTLWLPHGEISKSPSQPITLTTGQFAGQMLFGDVTYGGLQRAFLEKVDGEYQGAVFRHSQGVEAGVMRTVLGPDGAIYIGGIGGDGNWGQEGKDRFGLQKLLPKTTETQFDILSVKATETGFDITYTKPVSDDVVATAADRYEIAQWRYVPTGDYGGSKIDLETLSIANANVSADHRTVSLTIPGLKAGRVVHLHSPFPFASADNKPLWSTEAWYTLNAIPGGASVPGVYQVEVGALSPGTRTNSDHAGFSGTGFAQFLAVGNSSTVTVSVPAAGVYDTQLRFSNGGYPQSGTKSLSVFVGDRKQTIALPDTKSWKTWATVPLPLVLPAGLSTVRFAWESGDLGNVNLDELTLPAAPRPARIPEYEIEAGVPGGGLTMGTNHAGYSGAGFAEYREPGFSSTLAVAVASAGDYPAALRYSTGPWPDKSLSVWVNGTKRTITLPSTGEWSTWGTVPVTLSLPAGTSTVQFAWEKGDLGNVNLDKLIMPTPSEAEAATLAAGARHEANHSGYSGYGFTTHNREGASTTFTTTVDSAGTYSASVRFANGPHPFAGTKHLTLFVNSQKVSRLSFPSTANWDTWSDLPVTLPLTAGRNTIELRYASGDTGAVNIDYLSELTRGAPADSCAGVTPTAGYTSLFDGTNASLAGWRMAGPGSFERVADCSIVSRGGMGMLWHPTPLTDYSLKLDWKLAADNDNSGIFVGFPDPGDEEMNAINKGYEIQLDPTDSPERTTGAIYGFRAADIAVRDSVINPEGEWNSFEIEVRGKLIQVRLNGTLINEYTSTSTERFVSTPTYIGIQNHGGGDEVFFRNVELKKL